MSGRPARVGRPAGEPLASKYAGPGFQGALNTTNGEVSTRASGSARMPRPVACPHPFPLPECKVWVKKRMNTRQ